MVASTFHSTRRGLPELWRVRQAPSAPFTHAGWERFMEPSMPKRRKRVGKSRHNSESPTGRLLTVRSALIFLLAVLTALGGTALLLAAHRPPALAAFTGFRDAGDWACPPAFSWADAPPPGVSLPGEGRSIPAAGIGGLAGPRLPPCCTGVLIVWVSVRRPDWWYYPERWQNGHEWAPGRVLVCLSPAATAGPSAPPTARREGLAI